MTGCGTVQTGMTEYYVYCSHCSKLEVQHWRTRNKFTMSLRAIGWHIYLGLWTCGDCYDTRQEWDKHHLHKE